MARVKLPKATTNTKKRKAAEINSDDGTSKPENNRFLSDNYRKQYFSTFARRSLAEGRVVDCKSFTDNDAPFIEEWFSFQGWNWLIEKDDILVYPDLVKQFYTHFDEANKKAGVIHSWVKGVYIKLNAAKLGKILGLPCEGVEIKLKQSWKELDGVKPNDCAKLLLGDPDSLVKQPKVDELPLESRILLLLLQSTFISRIGRKSSLTNVDMKIMYCMIKKEKINIPLFIINYMKRAHTNRSKCCLPYAMWLTLVFKHFKVDLKNEVSSPPKGTPFTIKTITSDLGYVYLNETGTWKRKGIKRAPKRQVAGHGQLEHCETENLSDTYVERLDSEGDGLTSVNRAILESLVVQEMLKRLHPDFFTSECVAEIRASSVQSMTEEINMSTTKPNTGPDVSAEMRGEEEMEGNSEEDMGMEVFNDSDEDEDDD